MASTPSKKPANVDETIYSATWAYAGQRLTTDGKLSYFWYPVDQTTDGWQVLGESASVFAKKNIVRHAAVGDIYRVSSKTRDMASILTGRGYYPGHLGQLPKSVTVEWMAKDVADRGWATTQQLARQRQQDLWDGLTLAELKVVASHLMPERKRALAAYVLGRLGFIY